MFHRHNSFTNTLSSSESASAYVPQSLSTKEATNNYFVTPQPKGREPGGSGPSGEGSLAGRQISSVALTTQTASTAAHSVAATAHSVAATAQSVAATVQSVAATAQAAAVSATQAVGNSVTSHAASSSHAAQSHGHGSHAAPWEGVNLWRTPYKGDTDTITQVKRSKGTLDRFVEGRTRRIQQMQLFALRNKSTPTWVMMPRDKFLFAAQGLIVAYVLFQVGNSVYQHLKAKDRLKLLKLLYKDNVD